MPLNFFHYYSNFQNNKFQFQCMYHSLNILCKFDHNSIIVKGIWCHNYYHFKNNKYSLSLYTKNASSTVFSSTYIIVYLLLRLDRLTFDTSKVLNTIYIISYRCTILTYNIFIQYVYNINILYLY